MKSADEGLAVSRRPRFTIRYAPFARSCAMARMAFCMLALLVATAGRAAAQEHVLRLQMSPYTLHYHPRSDHHTVWSAGLEVERDTGTIHGAMFFRNTFGQKSLYVYPWGGVHRNLFNVERLYFKCSIGILWGYKQPYEDKVPLNYHGFSPAILPALGIDLPEGFSFQVNFLGFSGVMFQIAKDL
jgi:hypothetical protein